MTEAVRVIGREDTERRILRSFMRYGLRTQPASLVRGSSRRITIVRFRPADIRVIKPSHLPLTLLPALHLPNVGSDLVRR
jgi:hypothetical protein